MRCRRNFAIIGDRESLLLTPASGHADRAGHLDLLAELGQGVGRERRLELRVLETLKEVRLARHVPARAVEEEEPVVEQVVAAEEAPPHADGPGGGGDVFVAKLNSDLQTTLGDWRT